MWNIALDNLLYGSKGDVPMLPEKHVTIIFLSTVVKLAPSCFSINESLKSTFSFLESFSQYRSAQIWNKISLKILKVAFQTQEKNEKGQEISSPSLTLVPSFGGEKGKILREN